jgi:TfoX/Sxy family transcriptional regulator of competence genes
MDQGEDTWIKLILQGECYLKGDLEAAHRTQTITFKNGLEKQKKFTVLGTGWMTEIWKTHECGAKLLRD